MRVLLVYPRFNYNSKSGIYAPLGITYIASAIRQAGYQIKFVDLTFEATLEKVAKEVASSNVIGMSATTPLYGKALEVLNFAKRINPSLTAIIGGPHATTDPLQAIVNGFDIAVVGEGEETIVEILNALNKGEALQSISGIAFKNDGNPVLTSPRLLRQYLDSIIFPDRDLFSSLYDVPVSIIAGRGCPYNCKFCQPVQRKLFGSKLRMRSPENVVDEMQVICRDFGMQTRKHGITFMDDIFTTNKAWVYSFCQKLRERNLLVKWVCNSRVNLADEQMFIEMKKAGCIGMCFGVESGSQKILDLLEKGITIEQIKNAFRICRKLGLRTFAYLMIGNPSETISDLEETVNLIKEIKPGGIGVARTTPTPGSYLYEIAKKTGTLNVSDYKDYDYYSYAQYPLKLEHLNTEDLALFERRLKRIQLFNDFLSPERWLSAFQRPWKAPLFILKQLRKGT